ncbi:MAG: hypothetical protein NUV45_04255 [Tepidanaerobacteraceae bacterium]|jgi:ABC-type nickel/cobalt efflux system permease component RcnA|nr:hypothetical protein [Tepidanaerobacteraceae bacterium]
MQILSFIVIAGIALIVFYLFLRKLFNEDRLIFPGEKSHFEEKQHDEAEKSPPEEGPQDPGNVQPDQPEPVEKSEEYTKEKDEKDEKDDAARDVDEKEKQSPEQSQEIKM